MFILVKTNISGSRICEKIENEDNNGRSPKLIQYNSGSIILEFMGRVFWNKFWYYIYEYLLGCDHKLRSIMLLYSMSFNNPKKFTADLVSDWWYVNPYPLRRSRPTFSPFIEYIRFDNTRLFTRTLIQALQYRMKA